MAQQRNLLGNRDKDGTLETINYDDMSVEDLLALYNQGSLSKEVLFPLTKKILTNKMDNASEEEVDEFISNLPQPFIDFVNRHIRADNVMDIRNADKDRIKMESDWQKDKNRNYLPDLLNNVKSFFGIKD